MKPVLFESRVGEGAENHGAIFFSVLRRFGLIPKSSGLTTLKYIKRAEGTPVLFHSETADGVISNIFATSARPPKALMICAGVSSIVSMAITVAPQYLQGKYSLF